MDGILLIFLTAFTVALSGAIMPGPMFTMVIAQASKYQLRGGLLVIVGHALLEILVILAILLGLEQWMQLPQVSAMIGLTGGLVMIYLGYLMLREVWQQRPNFGITLVAPEPSSALQQTGPLWGGIITSLVNPYFFLWWSTIGAGYLLLASRQGALSVAAFYLGHILADFIWFSLVSYAVVKSVQVIQRKHYLAIISFCGIFMLGLGFFFLKSGYNFLL